MNDKTPLSGVDTESHANEANHAINADGGFWQECKARLRRLTDKVCAMAFVQKTTAKIKAAVDWLPRILFPQKFVDRLPGGKTGKAALKIAVALMVFGPLLVLSRFWCLVGMFFALYCVYYSFVAVRRNTYQVRSIFFATIALLVGVISFCHFTTAREECVSEEDEECQFEKTSHKSKRVSRDSDDDDSDCDFIRDLDKAEKELDELGRELDQFDRAARRAARDLEQSWNDLENEAQRAYDNLDSDTKRDINNVLRQLDALP